MRYLLMPATGLPCLTLVIRCTRKLSHQHNPASWPIVTSQMALTEFLNHYAALGQPFRQRAVQIVRSLQDDAQGVMVAVPNPNGLLWALLPRPDYDILDTWFTSRMRGTGSKDIVIRDAFVPGYRTIDPSRAGDGEWHGWEIHRRLSYRLPLRCMTGWDLVAPLIGMAQGAIDAFASRLRGTSGPGRTADSVLVQVRLAEASVEVDAARELHKHCIREILGKAERGEAFTPMERTRYRRDKTFAARLCVQAVNRLFEASGGGAILESEAIQRFHRDVNAASHHQGLSWDAAAEDFGRQALGLPPGPGRYG